MAKKVIVSDLMGKDHGFIEKVAEDFLKGERTLEEARFALERHFFMEEKATFNFQYANPQDYEAALKLIREHNEMLQMLNDIEECEPWNRAGLMTKFYQLLKSHSKFEEEEFYPSLDRNLSAAQKAQIADRLKELGRDKLLSEMSAAKSNN